VSLLFFSITITQNLFQCIHSYHVIHLCVPNTFSHNCISHTHHIHNHSHQNIHRAAAYMKQTKYDAAVSECTAAIKLNPRYSKAFTRRAECYLQLKTYDEAVHDFHEAKQLGAGVCVHVCACVMATKCSCDGFVNSPYPYHIIDKHALNVVKFREVRERLVILTFVRPVLCVCVYADRRGKFLTVCTTTIKKI